MNRISSMLQPHLRFPLYGSFAALGAFFTLAALLSSPSDPKNAVFLGYSLERILLGAGVLLPGIALLFLTVYLLRAPGQSQRLWAAFTQRGRVGDAVFLVAVFFFLLGWVLLFLPPYRLGALAGYVQRVVPIIIWLTVLGAVTSIWILFERKSMGERPTARHILQIALVCFGALFILLLVIFTTGLGIRYPEDYWYGAGVPVLGLQVLFALLMGTLMLFLEARYAFFNKKGADLLLFALIWLVAAFFWAREPISPNYFMPDTADNPIYPYSDGATFDTGAQYALIGQGIFNGGFFERSFYSIFLVYLHLFAGQDFEMLISAQAALFAIFPALIYLIGRELHSRALGVSTGVLLACRGVNAMITAKWIDTSTPKMILTDFPAAILIAVFVLLLLKWLKQPSRTNLLLWLGAVFALAFMIRSNVLTLLPVALVFIPFMLKVRWRQFVLAGLLLILGLFAVTLPWEIRNQSRGFPLYSMYYERLLEVLRIRYNIDVEASLPQSEAELADGRHGIGRQRILNTTADPCGSALCSIVNHFLHNLVTSFASLPASLVFDDLWNTIKSDTPYWKNDWRVGTVGTAGGMLIVLNLGMISLGVGAVWHRSKKLALLPLFVLVIYSFTNALGLTSGGRYVVPVDWIVYLYYVAGGLHLTAWFLKAAGFPVVSEPQVEPEGVLTLDVKKFSQELPTLAFILGVGLLLPLSELLFQPRYQVRSPQEIMSRLEAQGLLTETGYSREDLLEFLSQPGAMLREGRALYPRYYPAGEGEPDRSTYYRYLDYQRLVLTLIGPYSRLADGVVIPGFAPPYSFHAEDVVVLGCWNTTYYAPFIDAVVVIVTSGDGYVYNRTPNSSLSCPMQVP